MNQEQRAALRKVAEDSIGDMAPTIVQLLDYIEKLEKDAGRYQWLAKTNSESQEYNEVWASWPEGTLGEAVDAAMQGETE